MAAAVYSPHVCRKEFAMTRSAKKADYRTAAGLLQFIERSPSPWHAAAAVLDRLQRAGFQLLDEGEHWTLKPGGGYVVVRDDAAVVAFRMGLGGLKSGLRIISAHSDSPCLRVKPQGAHEVGGYLRLATEVYGSPILATFSDRDLLLAGRVVLKDKRAKEGIRTVLVRLDDGLVRLPNLPIHLNRQVNEEGLRLHKHSGLNLVFSGLPSGQNATAAFAARLANAAGATAKDMLGFELCAVDAQPGSFWGANQEFIASRQLDNLASCHAAMAALADGEATEHTAMIALFDHEEVGSESRTGAGGTVLEDVLARMGDGAPDSLRQSVARSWMLSADMAHAHHPAHPDCYDALHALKLNGGVALKMNANQRYATSAIGEAFVTRLAAEARTPLQKYVHRADLACGSTVGPICSARLGIRTIDVGCPMWAMHSCRESAGAADQGDYVTLMRRFLSG
jgi:aspartyl aminopeptidase